MKTNKLLLLMLFLGILSGCSKEDAQFPEPDGATKSAVPDEFIPSRLNDSLALVAVYDALGGENWKHSYWKRTPMKFWEGVRLEKVNGELRVVSLELYGDEINGQLPTEIGRLTELKRLAVAHSNFLKGSIIDEVYDLRKLQVLDFRFTELTGELSPRIGQLTELDTLVLWKSQFSAGEWDESGNIDVNFEKNEKLFSGSLPGEIGKLTKLRLLNLARCGFTGELPEELGNLKSLTRLDLSECRFTGQIPASLGKLKKVNWMALCVNGLSGEIPAEICQAESLETLILSDNQLTGAIPSQIGQLKQLGYFSVANNQLSGAIPVSIEDNSRLGLFYANDNALTGTIPAELGRRHPYLIAVYLENNQLTGSLPDIKPNQTMFGEEWCTMFYAANNRLSGDVPPVLMRYPDLIRKYNLPQQPGFGFDNLK